MAETYEVRISTTLAKMWEEPNGYFRHMGDRMEFNNTFTIQVEDFSTVAGILGTLELLATKLRSELND